MKITRLVCGSCGAALHGLPWDRLFFCSNCGSGWARSMKGLDQIRVEHRASAGCQLPLPFWRVEATVHVLSRVVRQEFTATILNMGGAFDQTTLPGKYRETGGVSERRTLLFPAFFIDGLPGIGVSLSLAASGIPPPKEPSFDYPVVFGGEVSPVDAEVLAKCVAVGQETEKADWLADIELVLSSVRMTVLILPVEIGDEKVLVSGTGVSFYRRAVPRLSDVMASRGVKT
jgi:hypothetical protein